MPSEPDCGSKRGGISDSLILSRSLQISACSATFDELQWCADPLYNRGEFERSMNGGVIPPQSVLQMDSSADELTSSYYDEISRAVDVNLAEIDMEHFRSEDLRIIPNFGNRRDDGASLSASMIDDLPSDDSQTEGCGKPDDTNELSIYRKVPLFSPLKEPTVPQTTMIDSLDVSSIGDENLVITCQANKDNYTIAFEESMTSHAGVSSSEDEKSSAMIQSEFGFTTWNRVPSATPKSHSLPDLLRRSMIAATMLKSMHEQQQLAEPPINEEVEKEANSPQVPLLQMYIADHVSSTEDCSIPVFNINVNNSSSTTMETSLRKVKEMLDNKVNNNIRAYPMDLSGMSEDSLIAINKNLRTLKRDDEDMSTSSMDESKTLEPLSATTGSGNGNTRLEQSTQTREPASNFERLVLQTPGLQGETSFGRNSSNSSGYASRQNSVDQINAATRPAPAQFLLCSGNRRRSNTSNGDVKIAQTRSVATQVPVYTRDGSAQTPDSSCNTSTEDTTKTRSASSKATIIAPEEVVDALKSVDNKNIYVCYPNYSLPDLSFLKDIKTGQTIVLKPTVLDSPATVEPPVVRRNHPPAQGQRCRPKSCTDYETLARARHMDTIPDWESLSLLLPDDVKTLVKQFWGQLPNAQIPSPERLEKPPFVKLRERRGRQSNQRPKTIEGLPEDFDVLRQLGTPTGSPPHTSGILRRASDDAHSIGNRRHSLDPRNLPALQGIVPAGLDLSPTAYRQISCDNCRLSRTSSESSCRNLPRGTVCSCGGVKAKKAVSFSENLNNQVSFGRTTSICSCESRGMRLHLNGSSRLSPGGSGMASPLTHSQTEVISQKRHLLEQVYKAIRDVVNSYAQDMEKNPKIELLSEDTVCGAEAIKSLIPALEALLADGLLQRVRGLFGLLPNSLWHLAQSLVQTRDGRKEIRDLVEYIETSRHGTSNDTDKFKCFTLGLLNLGCLDMWITILLSAPGVQQKHYSLSAFISVLSHYSLFFMQEELTGRLRELSELPFGFRLTFSRLRPSTPNRTPVRRRPASAQPSTTKPRPLSFPSYKAVKESSNANTGVTPSPSTGGFPRSASPRKTPTQARLESPMNRKQSSQWSGRNSATTTATTTARIGTTRLSGSPKPKIDLLPSKISGRSPIRTTGMANPVRAANRSSPQQQPVVLPRTRSPEKRPRSPEKVIRATKGGATSGDSAASSAKRDKVTSPTSSSSSHSLAVVRRSLIPIRRSWKQS